MSAYPKHDATLKWARSQVGVHESPDGSNRGPVQHSNPKGGVSYYESFDFIIGDGYPWCVSFIQAAWAAGGKHALPYKTAGSWDLWNWAKRVGWSMESTKAVPGDIIVFNEGAGHAAILETHGGSVVHTIDGNWGDGVAKVTHSIGHVVGAVHVPEAKQRPPAPKPFWLIVTSASGKRVVVFSKFATEKKILGLLPRLFKKYGRAGVTIQRGGVRKKK